MRASECNVAKGEEREMHKVGLGTRVGERRRDHNTDVNEIVGLSRVPSSQRWKQTRALEIILVAHVCVPAMVSRRCPCVSSSPGEGNGGVRNGFVLWP